jgi:hypothetical protein
MAEARSMPQLVIVTPALRDANNGNWQTAQRWQRHLRDRYAVRIVRQWPSALACDDAAMIALHARRSADSIAAWAARHPERGLAVVLTGTDLYRDIAVDASAQRSLQLARTLVVLQEARPGALAPELRGKCRVIYQSTTPRKTLPKSARRLRAVMVGHLREEKSPETLFAAARLLADQDIRHRPHRRSARPGAGCGRASHHGRRAQLPLAGRPAARRKPDAASSAPTC